MHNIVCFQLENELNDWEKRRMPLQRSCEQLFGKKLVSK